MTQQRYSKRYQVFSRFTIVLMVLYCVQWVPLGWAQPVALNTEQPRGAQSLPMAQSVGTCHGSQAIAVTGQASASNSLPASKGHNCCKQSNDGCSMLNCLGLLALATTNFVGQVPPSHSPVCFYNVSYHSFDALSLFRPPASA